MVDVLPLSHNGHDMFPSDGDVCESEDHACSAACVYCVSL